MLDGHDETCKCKRCEMARGYMELADMELELANTYANVECEAIQYIAICA